jgi:hypothetical protein
MLAGYSDIMTVRPYLLRILGAARNASAEDLSQKRCLLGRKRGRSFVGTKSSTGNLPLVINVRVVFSLRPDDPVPISNRDAFYPR